MAKLSLNMDEYLPLRDVVFHALRRAILTGELVPGERLMEIHLAQQLGVSRTPVREAIHKLELEGLVSMIPRKGAMVAEISERGLKDVLEVRRALDVFYHIVKVVHLPAPLELPADRVGQQVPVVFQHEGLDRKPVLGRLLQGGQLPLSPRTQR